MNVKELVGQVGWQDDKVFMYMYVAEDAYVCAHLLQQHASFMLKDYIIHEFYVIFFILTYSNGHDVTWKQCWLFLTVETAKKKETTSVTKYYWSIQVTINEPHTGNYKKSS